MNSLKAISLSLLTLVLISACSQQEASEKALEVIENTPENNIESSKEMKKEPEENLSTSVKTEKTENTENETKKAPFAVETYTAARFAALKGNTPVVINFRADWCPVCRSLDKKIDSNLSEFPKGTIMLKADFDQEVALKKELGITQQTTLVFYNAAGEKVAQEYNPSIEKISELLSS